MIRVIENLLCFQDDSGNNPDDICFTLLTPRQFKLKPKSRLYGYKFLEYSQDIANGGSLIEYDINQLKMDKRFTTSWKYPIIAERLKKLTLNWATYEDIFESVINQTIDLFDKDSLESIINYLEKENIITT